MKGKGTREALGVVQKEEEKSGVVVPGPRPRSYSLADDARDRCKALEKAIREQLDIAPHHKVLRGQLQVIEVLKGKKEMGDLFPSYVEELRRGHGR